MKRVAIIGLDGVSADEVNKDALDIISSLIPSPSSSFLLNTIPPYTPIIWTSISTGVNPGKHGVSDFIDWSRRTTVDSWHVEHPRIWEILSLNKMKSFIYNVPLTYPFHSMYMKHTVIVSGWDAKKFEVYPRDFSKKYGFTEIYPICQYKFRNRGELENALKILERKLYINISQISELVDNEEPDFIFVIFSELDFLNHLRSIGDNLITAYIKNIASLIALFLKKIISTYDITIVCSDHGFRKYVGRLDLRRLMILTNRYLIYYDGIIHRNEKCSDNTMCRNTLFRFINIGLLRKAITANETSRILLLSLPFKLLGGRYVYRCIRGGTNILIQGIYLDRVCAKYVKALSDMLNLLGFRNVLKHEIFWGPFTHRLPDIILKRESYELNLSITMSNPASSTSNKEYSVLIREDIYDHSPPGIALIYGEDVEIPKNVYVNPWSLAYIAYINLGIPLPSSLDVDDLIKRQLKPIAQIKDYLPRWRIFRKIKSHQIGAN